MKNNKKEKKALLIALSICVFSVGVAAWGTYAGISDYLDTESIIYSTAETQNQGPTISESEKSEEPVIDIDPENTQIDKEESEANIIEEPAEEVTTVPETPPQPEVVAEPEPEPEPVIEEAVSPTYSLSSNFMLPVNSTTILKEFSADELVYNETMKDYRVHSGVDVKAVLGETVFAVNNGIVKSTFNDLLLGNVMIIEHGEYEVWYCGLGDTFLVNEGTIVSSGQEIGSVKDVPFEQGETHLHIEVWHNGKAIDPLSLILP